MRKQIEHMIFYKIDGRTMFYKHVAPKRLYLQQLLSLFVVDMIAQGLEGAIITDVYVDNDYEIDFIASALKIASNPRGAPALAGSGCSHSRRCAFPRARRLE